MVSRPTVHEFTYRIRILEYTQISLLIFLLAHQHFAIEPQTKIVEARSGVFLIIEW